jgi:hypothetical protein
MGIEPDTCPVLYVALFANIDYPYPYQVLGWADGPIDLPTHPSIPDGMALEYQCCVPEPPPPPPPPEVLPGDTGDVSTEDELGPLYTGADPPQKDVDPGAIVPERIAAIRGKVTDRDLTPLEGVKATIHGKPEYGYTLTDSAGEFTLVVSGGGHFGVDFELADHLPVQRRIALAWNEITWLDPVALVDTTGAPSTMISASAATLQVAESAAETDSDGTRKAVVMIPEGTGITLEPAGGGSQSLSTATLRVVEYTVGDNGPAAMPGPLPRATAYTYAAAFEIDEANPGDTVRFSQPVVVYVDNFLEFAAGQQMPSGYYDLDRGTWVPADNGRIVKIVSVTGGLADLDIDGDDVADDATTIGVTTSELDELASRYAVGTSLWRMPTEHFSYYDYNPSILPPSDARHPDNDPYGNGLGDRPCEQDGSIIECENQVVAEGVGIAGTSFALHYTSAHAPGRSDNRTIEIPLSGDTMPASCKAIHLRVEVAG